ncbi:aminotransferase class I/II-fold pyridoxal phosphate-dependent enzyme [Pedobacter punctiformis]|uniref:Aminotransferase class I/II-fold pyridoxal phosphate-dependent enzyme n=1 Tax=Pedobacter punctiformis TaxID=3004097 RepID=A0ABT4L5C2_9SPHI|nr:aminotransferase class I/II-fold pyridoxal phosphate-dependent enzyme [Pedobacter sp. HCMS5-2]MCZ4243124.1 aminotransferase class I/II-fold pyridoxal phosphate-dependent enzyme [Pedobacter sp. HCMS5-2]
MKSEFRSIYKPFSNQINIEEKSYLYFGGTAYLGIPQNKDFIDLFIEGIKKFGLNNGTSRNNNIQLGIYNDAERAAAQRYGAEHALITSSGYLAAQLVVKALSKAGKVIYAPATHPSLWLENEQFLNKSFSAWAEETVSFINQSKQKNWVLISNSMNNLFPEIYNFNFLKQVSQDKEIILIADDSHGIGVVNNGLSAFSTLPRQKNIQCVLVASMAKGLGVDAGLVLSSEEIINQLKQTNEFSGASPGAAAGLYAFMGAEEIYRKAWIRLQENINLFGSALSPLWKFEPGFPAFQINDPDLANKLLPQQILVSSFPYPGVNDAPVNRIILSSWHTEEDINHLIEVLNQNQAI